MGIQVTLPDSFIEADPLEVKNKKYYDKPGVYIFYDVYNTPLYVGKTVSFNRRFKKHALSSEFFKLSVKVKLYTIKSEYEKDIYETHLINELKPQYNKAKTYYTRLEYEDMLHSVEEKITDVKCEIEETRDFLNDLQDYSDFEEDEESERLGESLALQRDLHELEERLKKLYERKGNILSRLST